MRPNTTLSLVKTPETPYCFAAGIDDGYVRVVGPSYDEDSLHSEIISRGFFPGGDYKVFWSRFKNLAPSGRLSQELKELEKATHSG